MQNLINNYNKNHLNHFSLLPSSPSILFFTRRDSGIALLMTNEDVYIKNTMTNLYIKLKGYFAIRIIIGIKISNYYKINMQLLLKWKPK
mmetsp:Transcript_2025/g.3012  ORF Transcript_2025/g.3012 Transcript_2025/m.3012 type:complete len:89 (+) Transcript_2025:1067-1333(+)